ncbi:MAG: hypothetical protein ACOYL8_04940 [Patescibacteria group bacterium]
MENFESKTYRDNLAKKLNEIHRTDPEQAMGFLEESKMTDEYKEAKKLHQDSNKEEAKSYISGDYGNEYHTLGAIFRMSGFSALKDELKNNVFLKNFRMKTYEENAKIMGYSTISYKIKDKVTRINELASQMNQILSIPDELSEDSFRQIYDELDLIIYGDTESNLPKKTEVSPATQNDFVIEAQQQKIEKNDDYLFEPILINLNKELCKEKRNDKRIQEQLLKLRNVLVENRDIIDINYESIGLEFNKFWRNFNQDKFKELSLFINKITKNSVENEKILRQEKLKEMSKIGCQSLNDLIIYNFSPIGSEKIDSISIHILPGKTISSTKKFVLLRDGLKKLATVVEKNPAVKTINAESWIIRDRPEILKRMGFKIEHQYLKRLNEFLNGTPSCIRADGIAKIKRDEFLNLYLGR